MGERQNVREIRITIANEIKRSPIFRDHLGQNASNTYGWPICEFRRYIPTYPLAVLEVFRHFNFFSRNFLPAESDLFDLLGEERVDRIIIEEKRRLFGSVTLKCKNCNADTSLFSTFTRHYKKYGTNFQYRCTSCGEEQESKLKLSKKNRGKRAPTGPEKIKKAISKPRRRRGRMPMANEEVPLPRREEVPLHTFTIQNGGTDGPMTDMDAPEEPDNF